MKAVTLPSNVVITFCHYHVLLVTERYCLFVLFQTALCGMDLRFADNKLILQVTTFEYVIKHGYDMLKLSGVQRFLLCL